MREDMYFANLPPDELAGEVLDRVDEFDDFLLTSGIVDLWRRSSEEYERGITKSFLEQVGEEGEFTSFNVNHYRNILRHVLVATTGIRPAFQPQGTNTDYETRQQLSACNGLLDYYYDEKNVESLINKAAEDALVLGEGYVSAIWDPSMGPVVRTVDQPRVMEDGMPELDEAGAPVVDRLPVFAGDVSIRVIQPQDVIRDMTQESWEDQDWIIVREPENRWNLVARYPQHRDAILQLEDKYEGYDERNICPLPVSSTDRRAITDDVLVYTFYHRPTAAVPFGRVVEVLDDDLVLSEMTMDEAGMAQIPTYRISAGDVSGAPIGYTFGFDLLAIQNLIEILYSTIATNQANFGLQCLQAMRGTHIEASTIVKGLMLLEYSAPGGELKPLELLRTPREIFDFIKILENVLETLSGVNSVARGNPEASLKSGAALALVQSQHIQFTRDYQGSYARLVGDVGTALVRLFKKNVTSPRISAIVGRAGRTSLKSLAGTDLGNIDRVRVNMGNYLARTPAGRVELATQLVQSNMIETPEQYIAVLETGRLEPLTLSRQATLDLIQSENEAMLEGEQVRALITDNHVLHITEHNVIAADTEARKQGAVMEALTAHLMEHIQMLQQLPPELAAILKLPVLQPPMPEGAVEGGQTGGATNNPRGQPDRPAGDAVNPVTGLPGEVSMPTNPATGKSWDPTTGGL